MDTSGRKQSRAYLYIDRYGSKKIDRTTGVHPFLARPSHSSHYQYLNILLTSFNPKPAQFLELKGSREQGTGPTTRFRCWMSGQEDPTGRFFMGYQKEWIFFWENHGETENPFVYLISQEI
jgi:hypothetical protein